MSHTPRLRVSSLESLPLDARDADPATAGGLRDEVNSLRSQFSQLGGQVAEILAVLRADKSETKVPDARDAFASLSGMSARRNDDSADDEPAADQDVLTHAVSGSLSKAGHTPFPRARFSAMLADVGGPARPLRAPRGRSRSRSRSRDRDQDLSGGSSSESEDDVIDPDDVAAHLQMHPKALISMVLSMLARGHYASVTEWAEKTKFDDGRNKRECLAKADEIDQYFIDHPDCYTTTLAKMMARMVGVQMADYYKDWSYCNAITGTAAPGLLLDLSWMKRIRRSARVYRSLAPAAPKSESKKSGKSAGAGSGSRNKSGYEYDKAGDGGKQRSASKGKSKKGKSAKSGPAKASAASGSADGGADQ